MKATAETRGRVALFATCYGNRNEPDLDDDLAVDPQAVLGRKLAAPAAELPDGAL